MSRRGHFGTGRLPVLSQRGRLWLILSLVLLILGTGFASAGLAALGLCALAALLALYLGFFPTAILVWRRYLELLWWVPRPAGPPGYAGPARPDQKDQRDRPDRSFGLVAQRPFELKVTLRNLGPLPLGLAELRVFASRCVEVSGTSPLLPLPARSEVSTTMELRAMQAGQWFLHGAAVVVRDRLGLFAVEAYFPSSTAIKVLPRQGPKVALPAVRLSVGAPDERLGVHIMRHRGIGGELRELRDYVPGDPFKLIAWKASARAPLGRLLVRDLDRETLITHHLVLDIGASMREGRPGGWKLDHAVELAGSYARAVLDGGDRVGLLTYDGAIFSHLRPGAGPSQRLRLTEQLLSVMTVVDPRFTQVSDAELCVVVARYLRQQEGLDLRVSRAPSIDDVAAWSGLMVAPGGELYDMQLLLGAVRRNLDRDPLVPLPLRGGTDGMLLRRFCLRFGIELPYGRAHMATATGTMAATAATPNTTSDATPNATPNTAMPTRAAGLAAALERIAASRGAERVVLISDLDGILLGPGPGIDQIGRAAALCRRRGHQLLCLRPAAPRYVPLEVLRDPDAATLAEIFGWEMARRETAAHTALARLGFHVIAVGPEDGLSQILAPMPGLSHLRSRECEQAAKSTSQTGAGNLLT